jgi:hypothetical protein
MDVPTATPDRRWTLRASGFAFALATLALMLATEPRLAIVWDEGFTLGRENRIRLWIKALRDPAAFAASWTPPTLELVQQDSVGPPRPDQVDTRAKLFDPAVLAWFWPFAREEPHGHPPFYAIVGLIGDLVVPSWPDLPRARLGPILVFSLTSGCLFGFVARRWGVWPGLAGAGAWSLQPQLFGHGHYATYDALLTSLWVDAILVFFLAIEPDDQGKPRLRWAWAVALGVLFGWAADTKLTGWFLPLPFLAWALMYRSSRAWRVALVAAPVALITLYLFNPGWWGNPVGGVERFLRSNLTRGKTIPIPIRFLGTTYNTPLESLPWYNTLAWTVMATPVGFLALAIGGGVRAVRRRASEPFGLLVLGHWTFLIVLRALPHTPGHDGVRLFLPAFGVLAILAGLGAASAVELSIRWGRVLVAAALIEGAVSLAVMMPVPLSYFSPAVGGLQGANALGMEPTYYWDGLDDEAIDFLNANTPPGRRVRFASGSTSLLYLKQTGRLKAPLAPLDPGLDAWYVLQNRPGAFSERDLAYLNKFARLPHVSSKLMTPLVWIFPIDPPVVRP